jgi:hypothetical protein
MRIAPASPIAHTHPMRRAGDAVADGVEPKASVALVPMAPSTRTAPLSSGLSRPDPGFIAHLIATAEQSPQTRLLRRAEVSDVQAAYRAVANQNAGAPSLIIRMTA